MRAVIKEGQRYSTAQRMFNAGEEIEISDREFDAHPWVFERPEDVAARKASTRRTVLVLHPDRARQMGLTPTSAAPQRFVVTRLEEGEEEAATAPAPAPQDASEAAAALAKLGELLKHEEVEDGPLPDYVVHAVTEILSLLEARGETIERLQRELQNFWRRSAAPASTVDTAPPTEPQVPEAAAPAAEPVPPTEPAPEAAAPAAEPVPKRRRNTGSTTAAEG